MLLKSYWKYEDKRNFLRNFILIMVTTSLLLTAFLSLLYFTYADKPALDSFTLNGEWTVTNANGSINVAATVPGGIYTDLRAAGVLPEDIYYRFNDIEYRWVSRDNWTYSTSFQVSEEVLEKQDILLVLHGVDTIATVYLNGHHVGNCDNMFVRYSFPVKSYIVNGENTIEVNIESSISAGKRIADEQSKNYVVPPDCVPDAYRGECHINQLRKMQASFAWDWGPAFPSAGLWKSIELEAFDLAVLREITATVEETDSNWNLQLGLFLEAGKETTEVSGKIKVTLQTDSEPIESTESILLQPYQPGLFQTNVLMDIDKNQVQLWWPNGYGDQKLYILSAAFYDNNDNEISTSEVKIGFRTIELIQDPVPTGTGLSFYIRVNKVPIFSKGSNWIPSHALPEKSALPETINHMLTSAKAAHMNMLRVWGGGLYESELFYQLADETGILIWQDFIFACSMYPTRPEYLESVTTEVVQQVLRLQHHPSVAIWAGNNENEVALRDNWYGTYNDFDLYKADYIKLYVDTIRTAVLAHDSSRPFVVASPSNGKESEEEGYIADQPQSSLYGDIHYYNYLADGWNPSTYRTTRFASEYGFQSLPSFETYSKVSISSDWSMNSEFSDHRQHHPGGNEEMKYEINLNLQYPTNVSEEEEFLIFIYFSQINQAMSIKVQTEHYRRSRGLMTSDGQGMTMGALYWQFNDIWQGPSWASIEFGGKWKLLHYFAKNFFAPALVSPVVTSGNLEVHLISDYLNDMEVVLNIIVYKWGSLTPLHIESSSHTLKNAAVVKVYDDNLQSLLENAGCGTSEAFQTCFIYFTLTTPDGTNISPDNFQFPGPLKNLIDFRRPDISIVSVTETGTNTFEIQLQTNNIAVFVSLEANNIKGQFSDNGFLMISESKVIEFVANQDLTSEELEQAIRISSLADYY